MSPAKNLTIEFIKQVAEGLGELNEKAVFVGGATLPFYLTEEMKVAARPTEDVDVVIEIIRAGNRDKIEEQLRKKGFKHDITEGAPLCRWTRRTFSELAGVALRKGHERDTLRTCGVNRENYSGYRQLERRAARMSEH